MGPTRYILVDFTARSFRKNFVHKRDCGDFSELQKFVNDLHNFPRRVRFVYFVFIAVFRTKLGVLPNNYTVFLSGICFFQQVPPET